MAKYLIKIARTIGLPDDRPVFLQPDANGIYETTDKDVITYLDMAGYQNVDKPTTDDNATAAAAKAKAKDAAKDI